MGFYVDKHPPCKTPATVHRVAIHNRVIGTIVTSCPTLAVSWIKSHLQASRHHQKVVGLDIEWRPSFTRGVQNPVATIQLCIKHCCLIFQLYRAPCIPKALYKALYNPNITYTGVKIRGDAKKLLEDYGLLIANFADIGHMAAEEFDEKGFKRAGLKTLVENLIGEEMDKPKHVALSNWEAKELTCVQAHYACADAYYSYKLGKGLIFGKLSS